MPSQAPEDSQNCALCASLRELGRTLRVGNDGRMDEDEGGGDEEEGA
jgi:hypothetical protein